MTGAYLRVQRDGNWDNIEVEHLTDDERREKFLTRTPEELVNWINMLCKTLSGLEPMLKSLEADGIIQFVKGSSDEQAD